MPSWDPEQYERFAAERARPFVDLVARVLTARPEVVVDLGCGPGTMTATLCDVWPATSVLGVDSSPEMIAAASAVAGPRLAFQLGDIADWKPEPASVDVIVSNAALQWVPGHVDLFGLWTAALRPGGALAFQVPVSKGMPAGAAIRATATASRWAERLGAVATGASGPRSFASPVQQPEDYVAALAGLDLTVDAWETTYFHVLTGPDPVLEWFTGTGLRPYLDALDGDPEALADFRADVARALRAVYPPKPYGTVLPFPRLFVVGTKATPGA